MKRFSIALLLSLPFLAIPVLALSGQKDVAEPVALAPDITPTDDPVPVPEDGCKANSPEAGPHSSEADHHPSTDGGVYGPALPGNIPGSKYRLYMAYKVLGGGAAGDCNEGECTWEIGIAAKIHVLKDDGSYGPIVRPAEEDHYDEWHGEDEEGNDIPPGWGTSSTPPGSVDPDGGEPAGGEPRWMTTITVGCPGTATYFVDATSNSANPITIQASLMFRCECDDAGQEFVLVTAE